MNDNLVSIITPAYNCEKYINHTIESVMHQTYENWEMIIIQQIEPKT
jgi:teichuronic acid biosynthesis glycosyltransferase TuaG